MSYRIKNSAVIENSLTVGETIKVLGKECIFLPVGLTSDRPEEPVEGMFRFNSTLDTVEFYNGSSWQSVNVADQETLSFASFNPDPAGDEPVGAKLTLALQQAADNKKTLKISAGTYNISDQSVLVTVTNDLKVICEGNVRFIDYGREVISVSDEEVTGRVPLGMRFLGGKTIEWHGGQWVLDEEANFDFDTTDFYDETNEPLRRPAIFFAGCENVKVYGLGRAGVSGRAMSNANRAAIVQYYVENAPVYDEEDELEPLNNITQAFDEYRDAYLTISHAFMAFFECENVLVDNCYVNGDTSDYLLTAFLNVDRLEWNREKSVSENSNFDIYAKIMNCKEIIIGKQFNIVDTGGGTMFQLSGTDLRIEDMIINYAGKLVELSRDFGASVVPSNRITLRNLEHRGTVNGAASPVSVIFENTSAEGPSTIENLLLDGVRFNAGSIDVDSDVGCNLSLVKSYEVRNSDFFNTSLIGRVPATNCVDEVTFNFVNFTWDIPAGSLHDSAEVFRGARIVTFNNCNIDCNKNDGGLASLSINGNATGCVFRFNNCNVKNALFALTNGATVEFFNSTLENFDWTYSPSTKNYISFYGSVVNGETYDNYLPETVRLKKTYANNMSPKLARDFNDLFTRLKTSGWYDTIDGLYMLCVPNIEDALLNIVDPSIDTLDVGNGLVYSRNIGITDPGDASIDTNINPFGSGPRSVPYKFTRNEAYFGVRVLNDVTDTIPIMSQATNKSLLTIRNGSDNLSYVLNGTTPATVSNINAIGFYLVARTSSTATALYKNKTEIDTDSEASVALATGNILIGADNSTQDIAYVIIGGTDTLGDVAELYAALEDFKLAQANVT